MRRAIPSTKAAFALIVPGSEHEAQVIQYASQRPITAEPESVQKRGRQGQAGDAALAVGLLCLFPGAPFPTPEESAFSFVPAGQERRPRPLPTPHTGSPALLEQGLSWETASPGPSDRLETLDLGETSREGQEEAGDAGLEPQTGGASALAPGFSSSPHCPVSGACPALPSVWAL
ncbi:hypothetical protein H920_07408 [Fukomys damarensis]|uniref:Uncharacterized protein n=1 Tax=Fukomys damarensis TaxID=885580 RepID=A0A091DJI9_FUKDA|nr:hypothetical protein H920_07408 [Fukomys damarensis]